MSEILVGLISGFIFGLGLCLSGLADPSVVQGFLDVAGTWNPALLFVMGAGLCNADWLSARIRAGPAALVAAF